MDRIIDMGVMMLATALIGLGAIAVMHWLESRLPKRAYAKLDKVRELRFGRNKRGK